MAKSANQKIRILYLWQLLRERSDEEHGLTLEEIASALGEYGIEAERKTLYDDLEVLRTFGIDIEKRREKSVTYHVVSREFELPELRLLVDAVQSSRFITHKKSAQLIKKLEGLLSRYEAQQLQRQVFVANRIKTMNESIYYTVDYIHDAINQNLQVSFQYFSWTEKKEKQLRYDGASISVSPWALMWEDDNYYMVGYDARSGAIKHYRVDKMQKLALGTEKREGAEHFKNFDMALYSKKTFGMYGGREETVKLRVKNALAGVMIDRFGQDVSFVPDGDEHFTLSVKAYISPLFLTWLMNFGSDVTVLSPESVRREFVETAKAALSQYE